MTEGDWRQSSYKEELDLVRDSTCVVQTTQGGQVVGKIRKDDKLSVLVRI